MTARKKNFWEEKTLSQLSQTEWESLCDGCGKCCLNKIEYEGESKIFFTNVSCKLFNIETCRCSDYKNRLNKVKDCIKLSIDNLNYLDELPDTCAYRLIANGEKLKDWHHLISGSKETIHETKNSVRKKVINEKYIKESELDNYIIKWIPPNKKKS